MKKTRIFSAVLAVSMLFSLAVSANFSDMPENEKLALAINNAVSNGILSGYEDGTVRPDSNITRAEMASIITRACGALKEADISEFLDVAPDSWYYSAFSKAYAMGAFSGDDQKLMHPQNNITFQECFTILSQVFDLLPPYEVIRDDSYIFPENTVFTATNSRLYDVSVLNDYSDGADVADWAKVFVSGVVINGGWNGENGLLTPKAYITRGQFAIVMDDIIKNYIDTPGTYTEFPQGNTMIRCNDVILDQLKTDNDIFISDSVEQGGIVLNNISANRLVVRGCATPVDENGDPENENFGIAISGNFEAIRIIRPYISADLSGSVYNGLYTAKDTSIFLGTFGG
ncbi:MAG: S-layer homology domain-containing protein [Firmicutes bacterium]|nr:S-layer homology domain-containing protein [Bacillota bacterium]